MLVNKLIEYPLLLLFIVAAIGYLIGSLKIKGYSLGVAAVLFVGLAFGAFNTEFSIPAVVLNLGMALFVYSIGLASGPAFFNSYKKNGFRDFGFILSILALSGLIAAALFYAFGLSAAEITGVYAGSTTNTPALASVIDFVANNQDGATASKMNEDLVIGYSYSYPMGVLGGMIAIVLMERILKIDYAEEGRRVNKMFNLGDTLTTRAIEITTDFVDGKQIRDILKPMDVNVNFGRIFHKGQVILASPNMFLEKGDIITAIGSRTDLDTVTDVLGKQSTTDLVYNKKTHDTRRIFVSNPEIVGRSLASLAIQERFDAVITRIRRGDLDMLATKDTVIEMGDRIRFVARREDMKELSEYFGDSYQESSKVNLFTFGVGLALGLFLGSFDINLGPDIQFKLGYAGGPLIVGLLLSALRRTGPLVWTMPYAANVTIQQLGLILLLAAIGVRSGSAFVQSFPTSGPYIFLASAAISLLTAFIAIWAGYKILKIPFTMLMGMVANQPAILDFANNRTTDRGPTLGYTMIFPIALIMKIVIAQLLFILLG